jgi:hypothetical protein
MRMRFGCKCKLLHHVTASQVVATSSIYDQAARMLFDDTLCLKQCMPLILFRLLYLSTKHTLYNEALIMLCVLRANLFVWWLLTSCIVSHKQSKCLFIIITRRGMPTIIFDHQNPLVWAITLHVPKALAPVTLNIPCSTCGGNRRGTTGWFLDRFGC